MSPPSRRSSRPPATVASRPSPKATVVIVGSVNMDLVVRVPKLPAPGETLAGSEFRTAPGGKGANQAVAIARLGGRAIFIGCVGDDAFGSELLRNLRAESVNTRHVRRVPRSPSGIAVISVEDSGQNSIAIVPGANARLGVADIRRLRQVITRADALLCQLEIPLPTVAAALNLASQHDVFSVLDTAPVPPDGLPTSITRMDILSPNQSEASRLTGLPCETLHDARRVARKLIRRHDANVVVVKMGGAGAIAHACVGEPFQAPAFPVQPVDTTAAGDAFTAALTLRLAEGASLGESLRFANAAGALATTRHGAQQAMPTRAQVERLLQRSPAP